MTMQGVQLHSQKLKISWSKPTQSNIRPFWPNKNDSNKSVVPSNTHYCDQFGDTCFNNKHQNIQPHVKKDTDNKPSIQFRGNKGIYSETTTESDIVVIALK